MKQLFIICVAAFGLAFLSSCEKVVGEGPIVTETRGVSNFRGISVSTGGTIEYKIDPVYKLELHAQQNILDIIETLVTGNELIIRIKDGRRLGSHDEIRIFVSAPYADFVNLSGSGTFNMTGNLSAQNLSLKLSGSGDINIPQATIADKLTASISGSGDINVWNGTAKNEQLKISGSGKIDLAGVPAEKAITEISGSGDMRVVLSQALDATISGSGSVYYRGNPVITTHISGSGRVIPF